MSLLNLEMLSNLSIRRKIWFGFSGLLVLFVTVGIITYISLSANERKVIHLVQEVQPTVVLSMQLVDQMDRASASLGFYLLSKEDIHKNDYIRSIKKINESVSKLEQNKLIKATTETRDIIQQVKTKIKKFESYKKQMLLYAINDAANVPAMSYAQEKVNYRIQNMMQWLQEILLSEESEPADEKRKLFAIEMGNIRHKLLSAVNELRLFLAFRSSVQSENYKSIAELLVKDVKGLDRYDEDFLTFEQFDSMEQFKETIQEYFKAGDELIKIHESDDYRKDAYVIRTELAPLTLEIQEKLNQLVNIQSEASLQESRKLAADVRQTQLVVISLITLGFISAVFVGLFLTREIIKPIDVLKSSASELALGHLDQEIDVSRKDELGALATSFSNMRDSIRKKIEDLRVLNNTGNDLALLDSRISALQTALKVMGTQTNVSWGSVYLFNTETEELEIQAYYPENNIKTKQAKSFRIGEGILGKAALQKKIIYIADTTKEPDFVNNKEQNKSAKAILCVPMMDGDEVFGVMNFSGVVDEVKFEASDAEFAETISRMTVVASKNIQMVTVIEDQNRNLEEKVEERTAELKVKTNDINNMLQNMHQGIFTIDISQKIHPEYSAYLENILLTKVIANEKVMDILFTDSDLGSNALDQLSAALAAILGEDAMMYDFNKHCLINEYVKEMVDGSSKILELEWDPIVLADDVVDKLMVTVRDVTEIRGLQAEAEQQKWELEVIGQILAVTQDKFKNFIKTSFEFIAQNEKVIKSHSEPEHEAIALLFRNMHTIKGNARTYGFDHITDTVHDVETVYDKLRKHEITEWDKTSLLSHLNDAKRLITTYDRIFQEKLSVNSADGIFVDEYLLDIARASMDAVNINSKESLTNGIELIRNLIKAFGTESVDSVLDSILKSIPAMAENLGKLTPHMNINAVGINFIPEVAAVMKNVMMHCFRNAIDHGLETVEQRIAAGKPEKGCITLDGYQDGELLVFKLFDDGRGLAIETLRNKAIEVGILKPSQKVTNEQVAQYIFHSGLSTAKELTDISGRGVGMDAVTKFLAQIGGSIKINLLKNQSKQNNDYRKFELEITLPANVYVKVA